MGEAAGPGSLVAGRYRLEAPLGEGGFGAVFRATDQNTGQPVALKVLLRGVVDMGPRFRREAELAMRLSHPNTVRTLDAGDDPAHGPYIALELLEGQSLDALLRTQGALSPRRVGEVALAILGSLEEAHARAIIHRDIKPANVFLVRSPPAVKVLDFGIAKSTSSDTRAGLTREGQTIGTPGYMAPEQVTGSPLGPETDLYALGLLMAEALTGRSVYAGGEPMAILVAKLQGDPVPIPPAVRSSPLGPIIDRAVAHEREARWSSAAAMRTAIEDALARMPDETRLAAVMQPAASPSGWGAEHAASEAPGWSAPTWAASAGSMAPATRPSAGESPAMAHTALAVAAMTPPPMARPSMATGHAPSAAGPPMMVIPAMGPPMTAPYRGAPPPSTSGGWGIVPGCLLGLGIVAAFAVVAVAIAWFVIDLPGAAPRRVKPPPTPATEGVPDEAPAPAPEPPPATPAVAREVSCPKLAGLDPGSLNASIRRAGWTVFHQSDVTGGVRLHIFIVVRDDVDGQVVFYEGPSPREHLAALQQEGSPGTWAIRGRRLLHVAAPDGGAIVAQIC